MSFLSNSLYSIINKITNVGFTFLTLVFIARVLQPEGQGEYSLLVQLSRTLFYFFSFGFPVAFVFYFGRKKGLREDLTKTFFYIYLFLIFIATAAGFLFAYLGHDEFFSGIPLKSVFIAVLGVPLWFMNSYATAVFSGLENFKQLNVNQIAQPIVLLTSVFILYFNGALTVENAILTYVLSLFSSTILNIFFLKRDDFRFNFSKSKFQKQIVASSWKYAFKTYLGSVSEFLIYKVDIYIIAFFLPKASLGLYVIAVNVVERIWMVSEAVSRVLFAKLVNVKTEEERNYFTVYTLQGTFLLSLVAALGLLLFGKIFVDLFFGANYSESVLFIYILLPGVVLQSTALMTKKVLEARGYPGTNAKASIACLVLNILLNIVLIPRIGVFGAAIATSVTYILYFYVQSHSLRNKFGIKRRSYIFITPREVAYLVNDLVLKKIKK